jgi:hypothetical protein
MISLAVVMRDKLRHGSLEMAFPDHNDPVEAFLLHRSNEALRVRIRIRRLKRRLHHTNPGLPEPLAHGRAPLRIPIANQHSAHFPIRHRERPHDLSHERFVRMWRRPEHLHAAGGEIDQNTV